MPLAISIGVLFISLIQSVNGLQILNITSSLLLPPPACRTATDVIQGCHIRASSFVSTQFFILNLMIHLVYYLTNVLVFDISLLYYYINLRSSIIFCLFSGDLYISLGIYLSCSFATVSELFCCKVFETDF